MIGALDIEAARDGIGRDIDELRTAGVFGWVVLVSFFGLPIASLFALVHRRWLAVLPLALWIGLAALWLSYYATDWIGPQSGPAGVAFVFLSLLIGWSFLAYAAGGEPRPE